MNINLIYENTTYQFDASPKTTIEYIKDLSSKISGQNSKINLYYKNKNLSKLIDKTLLEEITTEGEKNLTINIQKENELQTIDDDIPISNIIYNSRLNDFDNEKYFQKLRNRFLEYQKNYIQKFKQISSFEQIFEERYNRLIKIFKEFKKYINIYEEKLGKYYDDTSYNNLVKIFNSNLNSKNLSQSEINDLGDKMDNFLSYYCHLEIQNIFQTNIIVYCQYKIEEFLKLKVLIHQLNYKKEFLDIIPNIDDIFIELNNVHKFNPINLLTEYNNLKERLKYNKIMFNQSNINLLKKRKKNSRKYNLSSIPPLIDTEFNNILNNFSKKNNNTTSNDNNINNINNTPLNNNNINYNIYHTVGHNNSDNNINNTINNNNINNNNKSINHIKKNDKDTIKIPQIKHLKNIRNSQTFSIKKKQKTIFSDNDRYDNTTNTFSNNNNINNNTINNNNNNNNNIPINNSTSPNLLTKSSHNFLNNNNEKILSKSVSNRKEKKRLSINSDNHFNNDKSNTFLMSKSSKIFHNENESDFKNSFNSPFQKRNKKIEEEDKEQKKGSSSTNLNVNHQKILRKTKNKRIRLSSTLQILSDNEDENLLSYLNNNFNSPQKKIKKENKENIKTINDEENKKMENLEIINNEIRKENKKEEDTISNFSQSHLYKSPLNKHEEKKKNNTINNNNLIINQEKNKKTNSSHSIINIKNKDENDKFIISPKNKKSTGLKTINSKDNYSLKNYFEKEKNKVNNGNIEALIRDLTKVDNNQEFKIINLKKCDDTQSINNKNEEEKESKENKEIKDKELNEQDIKKNRKKRLMKYDFII